MMETIFQKVILFLQVAGLVLVGSFSLPAVALATPGDLDLAYRWAPVHYQDTDSSDYDADYLSAVDFDEDWDAKNNWEHQDDNVNNLKAKVYYSVVETSTHWYLVYSFFHPRDWVDYPDPFNLDHHENDMEGALMIVRNDGSTYGKLEGMVTVAHNHFYSFTPSDSPLKDGQEDIDGSIIMVNYEGSQHPTTFQEAKGHGLKAWNGNSFPGDDGVVYYPSRTTADVPASGNDPSVQYQLVDTFTSGGLWSHRDDTQTFASWGTFCGDDGKDNAANSAWGWDDVDDGNVLRGEMATAPAKLVSIYFSNLGSFSTDYLRNSYR